MATAALIFKISFIKLSFSLTGAMLITRTMLFKTSAIVQGVRDG